MAARRASGTRGPMDISVSLERRIEARADVRELEVHPAHPRSEPGVRRRLT